MRMIWKRYIPPKHSSILWLALHGKLNTKNLWFFDDVNPSCTFCKRHTESISHLFFRCTFVSSIWRQIRTWLNINRDMGTLLSAIKWIKKYHGGALIKSKAILLAFAAMVYTIWTTRNTFIFAGKPLDADYITLSIKFHVYTVLYELYPIEMINF